MSSRIFGAVVLSVATIVAVGCTKKEAPAEPAKAAELPADVKALESTATAAQKAADASQKPAAGTAAPAAAETKQDAEGLFASDGEFASPEVSNVAVAITGRVARVVADRGDRVREGDPLLELETDYLKLDVQRATADVARAQAAFDEAKRDLDRKELLRQKDSVPQSTLDRTRSMYDQAQAGLEMAKSSLGTAKQRLNDAVLRAPFDGVVMERKTAAGERLSERQDVAFVLARTAPLNLRFDMPERYLAAVKQGQVVKATVDPYPDQKFEGRVSVIGQTVDAATRTFFVEAKFPNKDGRLKPGLFARIQLDLR